MDAAERAGATGQPERVKFCGDVGRCFVFLPLQHTEKPMAIKELETKVYDSYFYNPIQSIIDPTFPLHFSTVHQHRV